MSNIDDYDEGKKERTYNFSDVGEGWRSAIFLEGTRFAKALGFFHNIATIKGSEIIRHFSKNINVFQEISCFSQDE